MLILITPSLLRKIVVSKILGVSGKSYQGRGLGEERETAGTRDRRREKIACWRVEAEKRRGAGSSVCVFCVGVFLH